MLLDVLSRLRAITLSPWRLDSGLLVLAAVVVHLCWLPGHKEDTVVNVPQHGALVLCVSGLHRLFLHLEQKQRFSFEQRALERMRRERVFAVPPCGSQW